VLEYAQFRCVALADPVAQFSYRTAAELSADAPSDTAPVDIDRGLSLAPSPLSDQRILLLEVATGQGNRLLTTRARAGVERLPDSALLPLPPLLRASCAPWVAGFALWPDEVDPIHRSPTARSGAPGGHEGQNGHAGRLILWIDLPRLAGADPAATAHTHATLAIPSSTPGDH